MLPQNYVVSCENKSYLLIYGRPLFLSPPYFSQRPLAGGDRCPEHGRQLWVQCVKIAHDTPVHKVFEMGHFPSIKQRMYHFQSAASQPISRIFLSVCPGMIPPSACCNPCLALPREALRQKKGRPAGSQASEIVLQLLALVAVGVVGHAEELCGLHLIAPGPAVCLADILLFKGLKVDACIGQHGSLRT
jgi:hypothetical protein